MASEIEEPTRRDLQVNCLHSGSISFGRFENDVLCWERRSSFSRNRYIEEIEKCSKNGLVTEKKAYFEAHFKKKGIQGLCLSENQSHTEHGVGESGISENISYDEEIDGLGKESHSPVDEVMCGSLHPMEPALVEHEKVEFPTSISVARIEPTSGDSEVEEHILKHRFVEKADGGKIEGLNSPLSRSGIKIENCERETAYLDTSYVLHMGTMMLSDNGTMENCHASGKNSKGSSTKDLRPLEARNIKPRLVRRVAVAQSIRHVDSQGYVGTKNKKIRTVNNAPTRLKAERSTSEAAASLDNYPTSRTSKIEFGSRAKLIKPTKRDEKDSRNGRLAELHSSRFAKSSSEVHRSTSRLNQSLYTTESHTQHDTTRLSFKFSEHAGRRKELDMKLDGKKLAKDAEMPYHEAKIHENVKAEIKCLRKNLNFKARPLPSFYTAASRESERNKLRNNITEPRKLKANSLSCAGVRLPPNTADPPQASAATSCHSTVTSESSPRSLAAKTSKPPKSGTGKNGNLHPKNNESQLPSFISLKVPESKQICKDKTADGS